MATTTTTQSQIQINQMCSIGPNVLNLIDFYMDTDPASMIRTNGTALDLISL